MSFEGTLFLFWGKRQITVIKPISCTLALLCRLMSCESRRGKGLSLHAWASCHHSGSGKWIWLWEGQEPVGVRETRALPALGKGCSLGQAAAPFEQGFWEIAAGCPSESCCLLCLNLPWRQTVRPSDYQSTTLGGNWQKNLWLSRVTPTGN